ncbi:MAG: ABC transporter ATP-binding protein [Eubacteriales bacterium]
MLKVENLSCGYDGKTILHQVSFQLEKGQNLCILGANGCGKTTLLKAVGGLLPYEGSIRLCNQEIKDISAWELGKEMAILSQNTNVYFSYSVYDTVMLGRYVKLPKNVFARIEETHHEYVMYCLEAVGIIGLKDREIGTLSGGQMQKVLLARTLAQEPKIILLDEPSNHLDVKSQMELFEFLEEWSSDGEHSVIGVLHDVSTAFHFFQKGLFLREGQVTYLGNMNQVKREQLSQTYGFDVIHYIKALQESLEGL